MLWGAGPGRPVTKTEPGNPLYVASESVHGIPKASSSAKGRTSKISVAQAIGVLEVCPCRSPDSWAQEHFPPVEVAGLRPIRNVLSVSRMPEKD